MKTHFTPASPTSGNLRTRMTPEQRAEIIRRLDAGEKAARLAREFGVSPQAVSLYRKKEDGKLQGAVNKKMSTAETEKLRQLLNGSLPAQHGLAGHGGGHSGDWSAAGAQALAEKLFGRKLFALQFRQLIAECFPAREEYQRHGIAREPMTVEEIQALMARQGLKSGFAKPLDPAVPGGTHVHKLGRPRGRAGDDFSMPPPEKWETLEPSGAKFPVPSQTLIPGPIRTGKHKGSKGSPFTKARKKKNR